MVEGFRVQHPGFWGFGFSFTNPTKQAERASAQSLEFNFHPMHLLREQGIVLMQLAGVLLAKGSGL